MPSVDIVVESEVSHSARCRQLQAIFDVPVQDKQRLQWTGDVALEGKDWNVGLVVGPSGSGKTLLSRRLWDGANFQALTWNGKAVIDDFDKSFSIDDISTVCQAVGFNTIPAWLRPFAVLSNGEQFRVDLARRLLELPSPVIVDEFTSVVDRQVAQIGAYAAQKYVRKQHKQFVGVTCHYDVEEWLMPDWVLEMPALKFRFGRSLQRRPQLRGEIRRVTHHEWAKYARYHYLSNELHKAATCFELYVEGRPAAFIGNLYRPSSGKVPIIGISRIVTLPDWQGLGLAFVLIHHVGSLYKALGYKLHLHPAHPAFVRAAYHSTDWKLLKAPGLTRTKWNTWVKDRNGEQVSYAGTNLRPSAIFEYCGPAHEDIELAETMTGKKHT